jgi:hypothetical protein
VVETLRAALNVLATIEPDWVRANIPAECKPSVSRFDALQDVKTAHRRLTVQPK